MADDTEAEEAPRRKARKDAAPAVTETIEDLRQDGRVVMAMDLLKTSPTLRVTRAAADRLRTIIIFHTLRQDGKWERSVPTAIADESDLLTMSRLFAQIQYGREVTNRLAIQYDALRHDLERMWNELSNHLAQRPLVRATQVTARKQLLRQVLEPLAFRIDTADWVLGACKRKLEELDGAYFVLKEINENGKFVLGKRTHARD